MSDGWTTLPSGGWGPNKPYTLEVLNPRWALDPTDQNNPDVPRIKLEGRTDDPEWEEWSLDLRVEREGWEIIDDGATIRHSNPRKTLPSANTQYGRFVSSIDKYQSPDNNLGKLLEELVGSGLEPTNANAWRGLKLVIGEEKQTFNLDGKQQEYYPSVVVDYEGRVDDEALQAASKDREELIAQQREELTKLANEAEDNGEFINRALSDLEPSLSDDDLIQEVMDTSKKGFYAKATS